MYLIKKYISKHQKVGGKMTIKKLTDRYGFNDEPQIKQILEELEIYENLDLFDPSLDKTQEVTKLKLKYQKALVITISENGTMELKFGNFANKYRKIDFDEGTVKEKFQNILHHLNEFLNTFNEK